MSVLATTAALGGAIDTSGTDWNKAMINLFAGGIVINLMFAIGFWRFIMK